MKKVILLSLALALSTCACANTPKINPDLQNDQNAQLKALKIKEAVYVDVDVKTARKMMATNSELIIIDVSPNYGQGHLPGAINYYIGNGALEKAIPNLDKEATYLVYCHNDIASTAGAQKLANAGFKNVFRLQGNYNAWVEAGYEIEK